MLLTIITARKIFDSSIFNIQYKSSNSYEALIDILCPMSKHFEKSVMMDAPNCIETLIGNGRLSLLEIRVLLHSHCQFLNRFSMLLHSVKRIYLYCIKQKKCFLWDNFQLNNMKIESILKLINCFFYAEL